MRMPEPAVQRSCAGCAGGAPCAACDEQEPAIHRMPATLGDGFSVPDSVVAGLGAGAPLDANARAYFEPRFGRDFGAVRVHTGPAAARSAEGVRARAFTLGRDVVFGAGEYAPHTRSGHWLLAHELTHIVQGGDQVIRRYEGFEHQAFGDEYLDGLMAFLATDRGEHWARSLGFDPGALRGQIRRDPLFRGGQIRLRYERSAETGRLHPVELTPGEVIALMGDFYETWEQLAAAPESELDAIRSIMAREHGGTISAAEAAVEYEQATGGRYLGLAERNDPHFAHLSRERSQEESQEEAQRESQDDRIRGNRQEWRRLHELAIAEAQAAGRQGSDARFHRAMLIDAAAGHFLTDAYAAGHLLDKSRVLAAITLHLASNPARAANPQMQLYLAVVDVAGKMPQLVLKNLHDRLNREGFWVTNARGARWRTFGDDHLQYARETQRMAALAVFQSRQQLQVARGGGSPNPDDIEALMPDDDTIRRATQRAIRHIPNAVAEVESLMYRNRALAPTQFGGVVGSIVESNLSTIASPAREQQVLDVIESANRAGFPDAVAPQFTLFSWQ